jgi:hypothetical protein
MRKIPWRLRLRASLERVWMWLLSLMYEVKTIQKEAEIPQLVEPAALAMRKVYLACPHIPPDTISAGIMRGGEALFFRHNDATEVFIGKTYDHAADKLTEWIHSQRDTLETSRITKMNRVERRAYAAHHKREGRRRVKKKG